MRERNVYFKKLKKIQLLCEERGWSGGKVIEGVRNLFEQLGKNKN